MKIGPPSTSGLPVIGLLLVALWLRLDELASLYPGAIQLGGDSLEYLQFTSFLLGEWQGVPPNRFPGLPLLLAPLFRLFASHPKEAVQVWTVLLLGMLELVMLHRLARHVAGTWPALAVLAMAAVHPDITHNAVRGLAEEGFMVLFLALILMTLRVSRAEPVGPRHYLVMGLLAGWMALTRSDGAYVAVPIFAAVAWIEFRRSGISWTVAATVPVLLLPFALPAFAQSAMEAQGIQAYGARAGRAYLQMEFMLGRMPYEYAFYKETSLSQWLFDHHTLGGLITMIFKSSVRTALALGERLWGQLFTLVSLLGMVVYIRDRKEIVLPLLVPLVILPQWVLMAIYHDGDLFRYNIRALPLIMVFSTMGFWVLGRRILVTWPSLQRLPGKEAVCGIALTCCAAGIGFLPFSLYEAVLPYVAPTRIHAEYLPKSRQVHPQLVEVWADLFVRRQNTEAAAQRLEALRTQHDHYAPTYYTLGLVHMKRRQFDEAIAHFATAVDIVPYFAEAGCWLVEAELMQGRVDAANRHLEDLERLRPDYPLVHLLRANLRLLEGDQQAAGAGFRKYQGANRYQFDRALERAARIFRRRGEEDQARQAEQALDGLDAPEAGLTSPLVWNYLGLDLPGMSLSSPDDRGVYYNIGAVHAQGGDLAQAEQAWSQMNQLVPDHAISWASRGLLYARTERLSRAADILREGLRHVPDDVRLLQVAHDVLDTLGRHAEASQLRARIDTASLQTSDIPQIVSSRWFPVEVVLPMTRVGLSTRG